MGNPYLIAAYVFTAGLLGYYGWNLTRRKAQARRELESLGKKGPSQ